MSDADHKTALSTKLDRVCKPKDTKCVAGAKLTDFNGLKKEVTQLKGQVNGYKNKLTKVENGQQESNMKIESINLLVEQIRNETSSKIDSLVVENKLLREKIENLELKLNETFT